MKKSAVVRARVEPEIKQFTDKILAQLGMSTSEAISLFYHQVALRKGLPFDVKIPNEETIISINEAITNTNLSKPMTLTELKNKY